MKYKATIPSILFSTLFLLSLLPSIHAGTVTIDWLEVDCVTINTSPEASASDDEAPCHGKLRTYQGELLEFINGGETFLYENEESWNECNDNKTLVEADVFDSWPDDGPVKGAQLFALADGCEKRFKVIFHKKKFVRIKSTNGYGKGNGKQGNGKGNGKGKGKKVTCSATTETAIESKQCHKECRANKDCIGLKLSGKGKNRVCTLFSGEMFVEELDVVGKSFERCRGLKTDLKKNHHIVLGE